ncbi:DUF2834 domain-containing protein [Solimonas terrae]|uniref:DUF2834 domain-containing protein n=1 Tax=Solimonas terrae TaxID=1396819 RepID=A0A6M2BSX9_9GAMM|nr:DUF2834 domain-containing protein [Solimonas terrae]NGY05752.1 DUF2834 domain-containing protein [Solimonas terrae]
MAPTEMIYALIGLALVVWIYWINRDLLRTGGVSAIEWTCYLVALPALLIGWYFNIVYMREYRAAAGWWHWTTLLFVNPASASGGQDLIFANLILFPLWTIVDGRRLGMKAPWVYFVMSLVTSYAFAIALFMAIRERQLRQQSAVA